MKDQSKYSKREPIQQETLDMLVPRMQISWDSSPQDALSAVMGRISETEKQKVVPLHPSYRILKLAIAAIFIVALCVASFLRFSVIQVQTGYGEQLSQVLPDGSEVQLNAASSMQYHPHWWRFNRVVSLQGEAFFNVQKGSRFRVSSAAGNTEVLGTSFNVYARQSVYEVSCYTGKVKVTANETGKTAILLPGQQAKLSQTGEMVTSEAPIEEKTGMAWMKNNFYFTSAPFNRVIYEISIRYNIPIHLKAKSFAYTGNFEQYDSIEKVLQVICKPNGYIFTKNPDGSYTISEAVPH